MQRHRQGKKHSQEPPAARARRETGRHNNKVLRSLTRASAERATARRQPLPWKHMAIAFASFGAFCIALFAYLQFVIQDDDDDDDG